MSTSRLIRVRERLLGQYRRALLGLGLGFALGLAPSGCVTAKASDSDDRASNGAGGPVAARIGNEVILLADLDRMIAAELFELRSRALHRALTSRLIDLEATERGLKRSQLRAVEIEAKVPEPSDSEASATLRGWVQEGKLREDEAAQMSPAQTRDRVRRVRMHEREETFFDELFERRAVALDFAVLGKPELAIQTDVPALGPAAAKVTLVEFADLTSSFTKYWQPTLKLLVEKHRAQVRFLFKQKPASTQPGAPSERVARAALCADEQRRYWEFRVALFGQDGAVTAESIGPAASAAGLDSARFEACLGAPQTAARVVRDAADAETNDLEGDPVVVINGIRLSGAHPFSTLERLLRFETAAHVPGK